MVQNSLESGILKLSTLQTLFCSNSGILGEVYKTFISGRLTCKKNLISATENFQRQPSIFYIATLFYYLVWVLFTVSCQMPNEERCIYWRWDIYLFMWHGSQQCCYQWLPNLISSMRNFFYLSFFFLWTLFLLINKPPNYGWSL